MSDTFPEPKAEREPTVPPTNNMTKGVETLLGDPKKAIIKLAVPMIIAMSLQTIYNVVDALWVSGLGPDALAAVGFFFPFFFILIAIAMGIGIGAGSALSRRIGAGDKEGADNVAIHSLLMMMASSAVLVAIFLPLTRPMFATIGAGNTLDLTVQYSLIMFSVAPVLFFINWGTAILRSEGDANRAMWATAAGLALNIVLDPIFIYTLGLGVAGAAWASAISLTISTIPIIYWMFIKSDTYVTVQRCCFRYSRAIVADIMKVGLPATVMQMSMSISMLFLNYIVVNEGGTDGIAVFTTGFRVVMIGILPLLGIATAVVSVTGAAFGAGEFGKLRTAFMYAIGFGVILEVVAGVATYVFAGPIAASFSTGKGGERIVDDLEVMISIFVVQYPFVAFGMFSSSMFQGVGKGMNALAVTVLRSLVLTVLFAYAFVALGWGLVGIWWGMNLGNIGGAIVAFTWARYYLANLETRGKGKLEPVANPD